MSKKNKGFPYIVPIGAELPERLDKEPGAFISGGVQGHPHGVFLKQSR